ncbi:MAG TPA: hypothetical protein VNP03_07375 [Pseudonocardia sp.]|nr:hypothetical protein [Pseudonocardia sp.]
MNTRNQVVCAWAGLVGLALIFVGLLLAGYVPAPRADATPGEIAAFYRDGTFTIRLGLFLGLIGSAGWAALVSVVWVQLSHIEGPRPVLAALQAVAGAACYVLLTLFVVLLAAAAFRPERAPESTQLLHDIGWFMAFLAAVPFVLQALATGAAILGDRSPQPAYPRWLGYLGLWVAVLLAPGDVLLFFHTGPFAYDGLISYWIPLFGFGGWMAALSWGALRLARAESAEPASAVEAPAQ